MDLAKDSQILGTLLVRLTKSYLQREKFSVLQREKLVLILAIQNRLGDDENLAMNFGFKAEEIRKQQLDRQKQRKRERELEKRHERRLKRLGREQKKKAENRAKTEEFWRKKRLNHLHGRR